MSFLFSVLIFGLGCSDLCSKLFKLWSDELLEKLNEFNIIQFKFIFEFIWINEFLRIFLLYFIPNWYSSGLLQKNYNL